MPQTISKGMHYTTMIALIISNVTVLTLAILMAGPVLGDSLGNIYTAGYTLKAQQASAKLANVDQIRSRVESSGSGELSEINDDVGILDESIAIGTRYSFNLSANIPGSPVDTDPSASQGAYSFAAPFSATVGNETFASDEFTIRVIPDNIISGSGHVIISAHNFDHKSLSINTMSVTLTGPGEVLNSDELPKDLNLADFKSATFYLAGSKKNSQSTQFYITGDITKFFYGAKYQSNKPAMKVAVNNLPAAQDVVQYREQFHTTSLTFDASDIDSDARVTKIELAVTTVAPAFPGLISNCTLHQGSQQIPITSSSVQYHDNAQTPGDGATYSLTIAAGDLTIEQGGSEFVEVKCDVGGGGVGGRFAVGLNEFSVIAIDSDARTLPVLVEPDSGQYMTIIEAGSLNVFIESWPKPELVVAGSTRDVGAFSVSAEGDSMQLEAIGVSIEPPDYGINGGPDTIATLELWELGGSSPIGSVTVNNQRATVTPNSAVPIPENSQKVFVFKSRFSGLSDASPASSGDAMRILMTHIDVTPSGIAEPSVIGLGRPFSTFTLFKSLPYVSPIALSQNSIIGNGVHDLYKFSVTADAAWSVSHAKFTFRVDAQGVTIPEDGYSLYASNSSGTLGDLISGTNDFAVSGGSSSIVESRFDPNGNGAYNTPGSGEQYIIPAGTTKFFTLRANLTGHDGTSGNESVSTSIAGDALPVSYPSSYPDVDNFSENDYIWSDLNFPLYSTSTATHYRGWWNGFRVPGLDSDYSSPQVIRD